MLSLPMIAPRPDASLWPSHRANHSYIDDRSSQSPPNANSHNQRRPTSHHGPRHTSALLAALTNDENTIEQRKQNVRRFGAGWLRPPGVAKTLQAMKDEELEKEEQDMMQRREQVMMDLAAAQQDAANEEQREQGDQMEGQEEEERDLDEEVPEASASESASDSSDDPGSDDEGQDTTVPFNEDSFIEGSMLEAEVSHMLEMEEAEMAGVLQDERDLDDDVPEAGSYEHTDSELEDSSDIDRSHLPTPHLNSARSRRSMRRESGRRSSGRRSSGLPSGIVATGAGAGPVASRLSLGVDLGRGRSSFGMDGSSSFMESSSFLRSSPAGAAAAVRGTLRDRFLGAVRGGRRD
ncbi:uncharacterized protein K460DRAFT_416078 [Cucurbitaria berberidis CBS 394.84]|uniref:Apc15p protein-domain-containing protein n=1 Tax=Cucurbitaria berberidis CBS 394.84 TaxID=1168544 RepID=A0A9P4GFJ5_9PLEO|nr:uncharacterized protein K460DRAFT_416078 [Cucurbitaria berberidis CBS 394.84]KAF1844697.1 hypothetical protein K460DRAFT_416078 [Cucurbitaria berberidis CBS 394.84]